MSARRAATNLRQMEQVPRGSGTIELAVVLRFVDVALDALTAAREEIDALNVYPVPDGDTGTNLFLTFESAHEALPVDLDETDLPSAVSAYSRGLLLGARGNSGVIMSQLVGALLRRLVTAAADE